MISSLHSGSLESRKAFEKHVISRVKNPFFKKDKSTADLRYWYQSSLNFWLFMF